MFFYSFSFFFFVFILLFSSRLFRRLLQRERNEELQAGIGSASSLFSSPIQHHSVLRYSFRWVLYEFLRLTHDHTTAKRWNKNHAYNCASWVSAEKETFRDNGSRGSWENAVWTLKLHFVQIRKATSSASVVITRDEEDDVFELELFHPTCF